MADDCPEEARSSAPGARTGSIRADAETRKDLGARTGPIPFAVVQGVALAKLPRDLHIPPQALQVFLQAFEGPLDLLLYLIRRQNIDILDIPITRITEQYMHYIELMEVLQLDLVGDYLLMAATLAEIKSRMLLPKPDLEQDEEPADPRAELVRRLQEYQRYRQAAARLDALPRCGRDIFTAAPAPADDGAAPAQPPVTLDAVIAAFTELVRLADRFASHHISRELLSVRERMTQLLERLDGPAPSRFSELFSPGEGRAGMVVTLLALLELVRGQLLEFVAGDEPDGLFVRMRP